MTTLSDVCRLAQNLARNRGYAVFPCRADKRPTCPHGFEDAAKRPEAIAELWERYPGPLIGIATGSVSGIDVLDIDAKHQTATAWWSVASKRVPPTRVYTTRSGGLHVFFLHAEGVRNTAGTLARGVDTRGDGGYVISWFAAGLECADHSPPAQWPAWPLECARWKPAPATMPTARSTPASADNAIEGVLRVVSGASEGERNAVLFWGAYRLGERVHAGQIGGNEASALLVAAARSAGLPEIEAQRTIRSAWRAA
jgi:hypothetical protein